MGEQFQDPESLREPLEQILSSAQTTDAELMGPIRGQLQLISDLFSELAEHLHHALAHHDGVDDEDRCHTASHLQNACRFHGLLGAALSALEQIDYEVAPLPPPGSELADALVDEVIRSIAESTRADAVGHLHRCLGGADD